MMEQAIYDMLRPVAREFSLYIDRQGPRVARGPRKKVTWFDDLGNKHDLDFVLERNGTPESIGAPSAFIESAWRRYTKHSVNKAGEIANALVPLRRTYRYDRPFLGALVAGEWTEGGINHMESQGISVLHLPMSTLVESFSAAGIDFYFDEQTSAAYMAHQVEQWKSLSHADQDKVVSALCMGAAGRFDTFLRRMREHLSRKVQRVLILPLRGRVHSVQSVAEALSLLSAMASSVDASPELTELVRIEVQVRYSNYDEIDATFSSLQEAFLWLEQNYL